MKTSVKEAVANALADLGVAVVTNVPGYGGSEVFSLFNEISNKMLPISFHEEVAYTIAHGAAITGKRSAALMKAHGIAKSANSAVDSLFTKVTAGFVTFIFEDFSGSHSDNIMEGDRFLSGMSFPHIKADPANIYDEILKAFHYSERRNSPTALLVDASRLEEETEYERREDACKAFNYERNVLAHVVHPLFADYQYKKFTANKLKTNFENIVEPELPSIPDGLPKRYKESVKRYQPFFDVFKQYKTGIVCGDTSSSSSYCLPPYNCIDVVTYIGGSIPLATGAYLAGNRHVWALTGDFGFISAGHIGLMEAVSRNVSIKIVIFNNKQAAATGGQKIDMKVLLRLLSPYEPCVKHIHNPDDPIEISEVLDEALSTDELRVVVVNY